jgi:hypothetical protein
MGLLDIRICRRFQLAFGFLGSHGSDGIHRLVQGVQGLDLHASQAGLLELFDRDGAACRAPD